MAGDGVVGDDVSADAWSVVAPADAGALEADGVEEGSATGCGFLATHPCTPIAATRPSAPKSIIRRWSAMPDTGSPQLSQYLPCGRAVSHQTVADGK